MWIYIDLVWALSTPPASKLDIIFTYWSQFPWKGSTTAMRPASSSLWDRTCGDAALILESGDPDALTLSHNWLPIGEDELQLGACEQQPFIRCTFLTKYDNTLPIAKNTTVKEERGETKLCTKRSGSVDWWSETECWAGQARESEISSNFLPHNVLYEPAQRLCEMLKRTTDLELQLDGCWSYQCLCQQRAHIKSKLGV